MNTPVMIVNGQAVTRFELTNAMQEYAAQLHQKSVGELEGEDREHVRDAALEKLLVWELIYQAALADGEEVPSADVEKEIDAVAEQFPSREVMLEHLAEAGVELELLQRSLGREIMVGGIFQKIFDDAPEPTDEEVEGEYARYVESRRETESADGPDPDGEALTREQAEPMIRAACRQRVGVDKIRARVEKLREDAEIEFVAGE